MKKFFVCLLFCLLIVSVVYAASKTYTKGALTGGTAGTLDAIDGAILSDGDRALVISESNSYTYYLNATSGEDENSPTIISPDDNAGTKRWILKSSVLSDGITGITTDTGTTTFGIDVSDYFGAWSGWDDTASTLFDRTTEEAFTEGKKRRFGWNFQMRDADISNPGTAPRDNIADRLITTAFMFNMSGSDESGTLVQGAKDIHAATFNATARTTGWDARGVSAISANSVQYGSGVATNEFYATNPATYEQSSGMQVLMGIITPDNGNWNDGGTNRTYAALTAQNSGDYAAKQGVRIVSNDGHFNYGVDLREATIDAAGIRMANDTTQGSIIGYDDSDYSYFTNDSFRWIIGGNTEAQINSTGIIVDKISTDGGANYHEITGSGGIAGLVDDPDPTLGADLVVDGNSIVSESNGDINITPHGIGTLGLGPMTWVTADGTWGQVLSTDGSGLCGWSTGSPGSGITAIVQDTVPQLGADLDTNGFAISSAGNADVDIAPDGTGNITIDTDQIDLLNANGFTKWFIDEQDPGNDDGYFEVTGDASLTNFNIIMASGGTNGIGALNARYQESTTAYLSQYHNGTNAVYTTGAGDINLTPAGSDVNVTGRVTVTADPADATGVGDRGYNDTRYAQTASTETITNHWKFDDNKYLYFGSGAAFGSTDSWIYFNGTDNFMQNYSGSTYIGALTDVFLTVNNGEVGLRCVKNGPTNLFYDNNKKLETTSAGVYVTGTVTSSGACCADFVFDEDYFLMPLDMLDEYVEKENHLPNMTINDTKELDLTLAIKELLVKVEEQSLYILQLHNRIKALEEK